MSIPYTKDEEIALVLAYIRYDIDINFEWADLTTVLRELFPERSPEAVFRKGKLLLFSTYLFSLNIIIYFLVNKMKKKNSHYILGLFFSILVLFVDFSAPFLFSYFYFAFEKKTKK
jgi:hypothetical protein